MSKEIDIYIYIFRLSCSCDNDNSDNNNSNNSFFRGYKLLFSYLQSISIIFILYINI